MCYWVDANYPSIPDWYFPGESSASMPYPFNDTASAIYNRHSVAEYQYEDVSYAGNSFGSGANTKIPDLSAYPCCGNPFETWNDRISSFRS